VCGEPAGIAPRSGNDPDIICIDKGYLISADGWLPEQSGFLSSGRVSKKNKNESIQK
jgi:hypothetical protein